jgi:ribosomal protein L11 methyltransferase
VKRRARARPRAWLEVSVHTSVEASEAAGAALLELAKGFAEEHTQGGVRLVAHVPDGSVARGCAEAVRQRLHGLRRFGLDPGPAEVEVRRVQVRSWASAYRRHFRPFRVGRFLIRPPWSRRRARPGETVLVMNPGMAFGTGLHESTRLCLRALPEVVRRGAQVADVGTGSGILAVAAAKLGARVVAVDCDRLACSVAQANVRANRVGGRVRVFAGDLLQPVRGRVDVVVMNITAEVLVRAAPQVRKRLRPGGAWVASGMVDGTVDAVLRAAQKLGLVAERVLADGEWRAVVFRFPAEGRGAAVARAG